jgi:hypothetical protein
LVVSSSWAAGLSQALNGYSLIATRWLCTSTGSASS